MQSVRWLKIRWYSVSSKSSLQLFGEASDVRDYHTSFLILLPHPRCYRCRFLFLSLLHNPSSSLPASNQGNHIVSRCLSHMLFFLSFSQIDSYEPRSVGKCCHYNLFVFEGVVAVEIQLLVCEGLLSEHSCMNSAIFIDR